jgi:hypothetical protein
MDAGSRSAAPDKMYNGENLFPDIETVEITEIAAFGFPDKSTTGFDPFGATTFPASWMSFQLVSSIFKTLSGP